MNHELAQLRERVRQNRTALSAESYDRRALATSVPRLSGGTFIAGDRVIDLVTGEEGEIIGSTTENILVPTAQ